MNASLRGLGCALVAALLHASCADDPMPAMPLDAGMDALIDTPVDQGGMDRKDTAPEVSRSDGGLNVELLEERVFSVHCALSGCHSGPMPTGRMNLETGNARASLVGVLAQGVQCGGTNNTRVVAGDPAMSLLVHKLTDPMPPCGARMPLMQDPLDPDLIQLVRDWVDAGAP